MRGFITSLTEVCAWPVTVCVWCYICSDSEAGSLRLTNLWVHTTQHVLCMRTTPSCISCTDCSLQCTINMNSKSLSLPVMHAFYGFPGIGIDCLSFIHSLDACMTPLLTPPYGTSKTSIFNIFALTLNRLIPEKCVSSIRWSATYFYILLAITLGQCWRLIWKPCCVNFL